MFVVEVTHLWNSVTTVQAESGNILQNNGPVLFKMSRSGNQGKTVELS